MLDIRELPDRVAAKLIRAAQDALDAADYSLWPMTVSRFDHYPNLVKAAASAERALEAAMMATGHDVASVVDHPITRRFQAALAVSAGHTMTGGPDETRWKEDVSVLRHIAYEA